MRKIQLLLIFLTAPILINPIGSETESQRRYVNVSSHGNLPFSDGVLVGNTLYLAGHLGLDPGNGQAPQDVEKEIRLLLDGFKSTLKESNMTMDDLVSVQVFCTDVSLYEKFNNAYRAEFTGSFPARAFLGISTLLRGAHFEMQGVAVKR